MTITRIGASKKYAQNWGLAFQQKSVGKTPQPAQKAKAAAPKKVAKKKPAKEKTK